MSSFLDAVVNLGDLFDRARPTDAVAVIDCLDWDHPRQYTYGELDRLADACARGLLRRGLRRGDAVAILSGNRAEFLAAYLGTMRAGLVSVPVNHKFSRETLEFVMKDAAVKLVFADGERRSQAPSRRCGPSTTKRPWSSTPRARRAGPRACRCPMTASSGPCARAWGRPTWSHSASSWPRLSFT